jgi:hypothetical protein
MGGRRATSLGEILGTGLGPQKASFTRAIGHKDPESIATSSAKLAAESDKISDILFYASKLTNFVLEHAKSKKELNHEERLRLARQEWSRIKKEEGIEDNPIITRAIVLAAARAIGKRRKQ